MDLNSPIRGYQKQSQVAVGFLVGYHVGPAVLQTYLTRVVYQKNYGGYDTRLWASISAQALVAAKFGDPFATRAYLLNEIYKRMPGLALRASHSMTTCERPAADPANACCLAAAGQSGSALEPAERIGTRY